MGTIYWVRHGQASFGAQDYDQLSVLGEKQSRRLGEYFARRGITFEAALSGSLKRQVQTHAAIGDGWASTTPLMAALPNLAPGVPPASVWPALNEYNSEALIASVQTEPLEPTDSPEAYRKHFRLLRTGLTEWMAARTQPVGMPSYRDFVAGIVAAMDHVRAQHSGNVLMVSSGGPISTAVGQVLGMAAEATIELNLRIRNSSVTEMSFSARRCTLLTYNTLPHLDDPATIDWITYA